VLIVLVLISFSHDYSAILAAKLMIKLDLTWLLLPCAKFSLSLGRSKLTDPVCLCHWIQTITVCVIAVWAVG